MNSSSVSRLDSIDLIKGAALIWIYLNHVAEAIWGHPLFGNPGVDWPEFAERCAQLAPMNGQGISGLAANLLRYVGWMGDQAVGWFILLSGLALSASRLARHAAGQTDSLSDFYLRRFRRIFPMWWTVHLLILLPIALLGWKITIADPRFFLSFVGIRITPDQLYFGIPAWWFVSLLLQLYLVFPFLHRLFERLDPTTAAGTLIAISLLLRVWGMQLSPASDWIDAWNRGFIFVSRMSEFASGMWLAFAFHRKPDAIRAWLVSRRGLTVAILMFVVGNVASISRWGIAVAPWLMTLGGIGLAFQLLHSRQWESNSVLGAPLRWIGQHSLSLFLVHHPIAWFLLRHEESSQWTGRILLRMVIGLLLAIVLAIIVEWLSGKLTQTLERAIQKWGVTGSLIRGGAVLTTVTLLVLPFELAVRKYAPQDITDFGWSERPSLIADNDLGFRLKPSSQTRLRWESYDYTVTANAAGFPEPELPGKKIENAFRMMTLGDAFTSAEGVDTKNAWPRLLESKLRAEHQDRQIDVVNFGVTGFGPNQYVTIAEKYVPQLKPDLIVIGFFTNDYVDVQSTAKEFQRMIGFDKPPSGTWLSLLTGRHLARYLRGNVAEAILERCTGEPCSHTRFFCQSDLFDRSNVDYVETGRDLVRERFAEIAEIAEAHNALVCIMSIPAPIQAVPIEQLKYVRPCLNLLDEQRYDYERPQRLTAELTQEFKFEHVDLRNALREAAAQNPFQSRNLHFTEAGHDVVSSAILPVVQRHMLPTK